MNAHSYIGEQSTDDITSKFIEFIACDTCTHTCEHIVYGTELRQADARTHYH